MATDVDAETVVDELIASCNILVSYAGRYKLIPGIVSDYRCMVARLWFELAKLDPEGSPLLNAMSTFTNMREANILDALLARAGLPWDVQPEVLAWGEAWEPEGVEDTEQEQGQEAA